VLASIGGHVAEIGREPLLIADENVWKLTGDQLASSFKEAGVEFKREVFGGVCSHREIDRITKAAQASGADVVVGIGGGTTLDTAKAVGHKAGIAWVTAPTVASTDAPTSALSVVSPTAACSRSTCSSRTTPTWCWSTPRCAPTRPSGS
jgi:glycerol dehydrogenase